MKKLLLILAFGSVAFAQQFQQIIGFPAFGGTATSNAQNTAATWIMSGIYSPAAVTLTDVYAYASTVNGTLASGDLQALVCSDANNGNPGACSSPIASTTTASGIPTTGASGWIHFSGLSVPLSAYTQYWVVLQNINGTPATNYPTYRYISTMMPFMVAGLSSGYICKATTNSGGTWAGVVGAVQSVYFGFSGAVYQGYPYQAYATVGATAEKIYSTQELSATFTMLANTSVNVSGVMVSGIGSGTPTGNLRAKIYSDNGTTATLLGTSQNSFTAAQTASANQYAFDLSPSIPLVGGTKYRVAFGETANADASTKAYLLTAVTISSAAPTALLPFAGTIIGAYCAGTCTTSSNWTNTYDVPPIGLILTPGSEFNSTGSSGGQKVWGSVK